MQMQRIIYHIDGKDYEDCDIVVLKINIQTVSIQNVLTLLKNVGGWYYIKHYSPVFTDYHSTFTNGNMKEFVIVGTARTIVEFAKKLGKTEQSELNSNWFIRNSELRAVNFGRFKNYRFEGISCFDPITKQTTFKSNSPKKIVGRQAIINGKLWRKFYGPSMR